MAYDEDTKKKGRGGEGDEPEVAPDAVEEVLEETDDEEDDPLMAAETEEDKWE